MNNVSITGIRVGLLVVGLWGLSICAEAQSTFHVRPPNQSYGSGDGSDWDNALSGLPNNLARGATYYIAAGHYPSRTFGDQVDGDLYITITKATEHDHGSSEGWELHYSGQAAFGHPVRFNTSYYVFDGQERNEADWNDGAAYGFQVNIDEAGSSAEAYGLIFEGVSNIHVAYVNTDGYRRSDAAKGLKLGGPSAAVRDISIAGVRLANNHDDAIKFVNGEDVLIERCYIGPRLSSATGLHGDGIEIHTTANVTFRNNIMHYRGDGIHFGIMAKYSENWYIYGNLFREMIHIGHTAIKVNSSASSMGSVKVYNNTFYDVYGAANTRGVGASFIFKNNIYCEVSAYKPSGSTNIEVGGDVFVDVLNSDFRLNPINATKLINAGQNLGEPYHIDRFGSLRGWNGAWDIGAYEWLGDTDSPPPIISDVNISDIALDRASISWTTHEPASSLVEYGTSFAYGANAGFTELVTEHSVVLLDLDSDTTYHFRAQSANADGNLSVSGNYTFSTLPAVGSPPEEPPAEPAEGMEGYWKLDETQGLLATDSSGAGRHGTLLKTTGWRSEGRFGGALAFSAADADDYLDLGDFSVAGNQLTLAAWINIAAFGVDSRIIAKTTGHDYHLNYWMLEVTGGTANPQFGFRVHAGGSLTRIVGGALKTGEWIHVAGVYDGTMMRLYRNGIEVAATAKSGEVRVGAAPVWAGDNPTNKERAFTGLIDELRVYSRALSAAEVQALHLFNPDTAQSPPSPPTALGFR